MSRKLILGSTSQPRLNLLKKLQTPFEVAAPDIDETPLLGENAEQLVLRLAEAKARKVGEQFPDSLIIGADQVGVLNNQILSKPLSHDDAVKQLRAMSSQRVEFFIGLCLLDTKDNSRQLALETYSLTFRRFTEKMIQTYLQKEDALQCAGSFKAEGLGIALVQALHDTDFSALIGLPLIRLTSMLEKAGLSVLN